MGEYEWRKSMTGYWELSLPSATTLEVTKNMTGWNGAAYTFDYDFLFQTNETYDTPEEAKRAIIEVARTQMRRDLEILDTFDKVGA